MDSICLTEEAEVAKGKTVQLNGNCDRVLVIALTSLAVCSTAAQ